MATWNFSGYKNGRGASVTFTYTTSFNRSTNQTTVTITNIKSVFNTGGASSVCALSGTLTVKAADNTGSSGTYDVSQSKNGNSITISTDVSKTITVSHGIGTNKQVILSFNGDINAAYYHSYPTDSSTNTTVTAASATARTLSISAGAGTSITVNRTSSPWAATGGLSSGAAIYDGDVLKITFGVSTGYNLGTHTVNGSTFTTGNTHTVSANVTVVSTASVKSYSLSISTDGHATVTVNRTSSPLQGASTGNISDGETIYYNDVISVDVTPNGGYEVETATLNDGEIVSPHTVSENVSIVVVTSPLGFAYIDINTEVTAFSMLIDTGSVIERFRAYIDNGESIVPY